MSGGANLRSRFGVVLALPVCIVWGCSFQSRNEVATHPADGTIISDGEPAVGVQVILHPAAGNPTEGLGIYPNGVTDTDGFFQLTTYRQNDGAPAGEWVITLTWPDDSISPSHRARILEMGDSLPDRLRGRFADTTKSPWRRTISEGENHFEPIDLALP